MNLAGGEAAALPAADDPDGALLTQESFGPAGASGRRCHATSPGGQALRFARRRAAAFRTLTVTHAGSPADLADADSSNAAVRP